MQVYRKFARRWNPREHDRPIRVLFISESPPSPEKDLEDMRDEDVPYFYNVDDYHDCRRLSYAVSKLFLKVTPETWKSGKSLKEAFLNRFCGCGFFLLDICNEPIDNLEKKERKARRRISAETLRNRVVKLEPDAVVVLMKSMDSLIKPLLEGRYGERYIAVKFPQRFGTKTLMKALLGLGFIFNDENIIEC